jgi:pyrroline-5-carboxylate reductase
MDNLRVSFLGTGSMGSAVMKGLLAAGHPAAQISATTKSAASASALRQLGISAMSLEEAADANALMAGDADLIVLGVKPYQLVEVLAELDGEIAKNAVVISMAAGISLAAMAAALPDNPNLVRSMPNTPALVGKGVTGISAGPDCSKEAMLAAAELFAAVGAVIEIPERQINPLSAISGSGPAWVYYFIEQWEAIAIEQGFTKEQAELMVRGTFDGAIELLAEGESEPAKLRQNVTSPGGTTAKIIETFDQAELKSIFEAGLLAAVKRAEEIASTTQ